MDFEKYEEIYNNSINGQWDLFDIAILTMKKSELLHYIEHCQGQYGQQRHKTISQIQNRLERIGE